MYKITHVCRGGGYHYCRTDPPHPKANSNGLYPLHRVVAENKIGRSLRDGEQVHHLDENRDNNSPDNLVVMTCAGHAKLHNPALPDMEAECGTCGSAFAIKPRAARLRLRRNLTGLVYCSRYCGGFAGKVARQNVPRRKPDLTPSPPGRDHGQHRLLCT